MIFRLLFSTQTKKQDQLSLTNWRDVCLLHHDERAGTWTLSVINLRPG